MTLPTGLPQSNLQAQGKMAAGGRKEGGWIDECGALVICDEKEF